MRHLSETYLDMFDPGWREREKEHIANFANVIERRPEQRAGLSVCPYCQHVNGGHSMACTAIRAELSLGRNRA